MCKRTRFCCSAEQFKPQEMFKTGNDTLTDGSVRRTDPLIFTTMPASACSCCSKTSPVELESELS